jgi:ribosomal protein S27AE
MNLGQYVLTLGAVPFFASRLFLTTFLLALVARLAQDGHLAFLDKLGPFKVDLLFDLPAWLTHPTTLYVLAVLAVLESLKEKNNGIRGFFELVDAPTKSFGSLVVNSGVKVKAGLGAAAAGGFYTAGFGPEMLWAIVPAGLVWVLAGIRRRIYEFLDDLDPEDDLGAQGLLSWAEDGWVFVGVLMFVIFPWIALVAAAMTAAGLVVVDWRLKAREEALKVRCPNCSGVNHPSAMICGNCKIGLPEAHKIGFWGQPKKALVDDVGQHRLRLLAKKRCPACATPLSEKSVRQVCGSCGAVVFESPGAAELYVQRLNGRLPRTLVIAAAMSAVPFLGIVPGVIYYRLSLLAGLRDYIPRGRNILVRWFVRLVSLALLAFQWLPFFGALSLPAMCLLNYLVYRSVFRSECERKLAEARA